MGRQRAQSAWVPSNSTLAVLSLLHTFHVPIIPRPAHQLIHVRPHPHPPFHQRSCSHLTQEREAAKKPPNAYSTYFKEEFAKMGRDVKVCLCVVEWVAAKTTGSVGLVAPWHSISGWKRSLQVSVLST